MRNDDIRQATRLLMRILKGESLEAAVEVAGAQLASPRIRAWIYGVCRHYFSLSEQLAQLCRTPLHKLDREVLSVLLLGMYQLTHTDAKPHAVVSESVEAIKRLRKQSAATLVNAVLRKVDPQFAPNTPSGKYELPGWFIGAIKGAYGEQPSSSVLPRLNCRMPQSLRINRHKSTPASFHQALQKSGVAFTTRRDGETVILCKPQRTDSIPGYQEGWFSVQDANAQLPVRELGLEPGMRVLDACAAPGNKAFQLLEHDIELTALDISPSRSAWSKAEGRRLGLPLTITEADASQSDWWDRKPYDRILLDAPCSATGTIGRHPDIKIHRQRDQLQELQARQLALLANLWQMLDMGGVLLYCTCSLLPQENDHVIEKICASNKDVTIEPVGLSPTARPLVSPQSFGTQIFPDPDWGDGFYLAKLRKIG